MAQPSRVGDLLAGKYRLDALLGSGGVGDVYRAQNTLIGRTVAIKVLKPEHATDDGVVARFLREAKAANLARHPNVVDVLDVGLDDEGVPFIVQEFLEGIDLGQHLKRSNGALPYRQVLDLMIPVVEAVGLAHARGVVHRDLKPENVFLAKIGGAVVPKLLDFGISYIKPQPGDIRMTRTGMTVGTPAYMSPEQLEGTAGVDVRTDVWALGVILYEALAGRLPFEGETSALLFAQIAWVDPLPLQEAAPRVPERLTQVVGRCLRRRVQERYPSAAELARDLVHVREGRPLEPTKHGPASGPVHAQVSGPVHARVSSPVHGVPVAMPEPPSSRRAVVPVAESIEAPAVASKSGIALATLPPPPKVNPATSTPPDAAWQEWVPRTMAYVAVVLLVAGFWMTLLHRPEGWPAHAWLMSAMGGVQTALAWLLAVASAGAGIWLGVRHYQVRPRLWGMPLVVLGLAMVAAPVGWTMINPGPEVAVPPVAWGWGLAIAAAGVGMSGAQQAWTSWDRGDTVGKVLGCVWVAAATVAFLAGFEVLRAMPS